MKNRFLYLALISLSLLTACSTFKVDIDGDKEQVKKWKNVAVLEILISPPTAPTFPLIDAGIYKGSFSGIYGEVAAYHEKNCDSLIQYLGEDLAEISDANVLYGKNLFDKLAIEELKSKGITTFPPNTDNDDFPKISLPAYAANFVNLSERSDLEDGLEGEEIEALKPQIAKLCELLKVEGVIVGTLGVHTTEVGTFGSSGTRMLTIQYLFFDKNGDNVCVGDIASNSTEDSPDNLLHYTKMFNRYYSHTDMFLKKLYLDEEPNPEKYGDSPTGGKPKISKKSAERRKG